jgi:radical SAM superfamily enzyme YgiQ (UPF0313 family)
VKKILLVNTNTESAPYPVPPVGLCLLASTLCKTHEVRIFDGLAAPAGSLPRVVRSFAPDYVGVGIRNIDSIVLDKPVYYIDDIHEKFFVPIKRETDAPIIAGGSGFSVFPFELMERSGADYGIVGEGEAALAHLVAALDRGDAAAGIPGVIKGNTVPEAFVGQSPSLDMDTVPFSEVDRWIDFSPYARRGAYPIQTKRGCGHRCVYCTYPCIEGVSYRRRSPEAVADEIEQAAGRLGDVTFEFVDSTFNDPPGHAEAICRAIIGKNITVRLRTMGINPAHASRELFDLMLAAGFSQIDCTPDSGSSTMLANLRKNFTLPQLETTADLIRRANIPTMWFFVFGGPGETEKTIAETFAFVDKWVNPEDMVYMMAGLRIYPNTELHRIALREGIVGPLDPLLRPVFYLSPLVRKDRIDALMQEAAETRHNCVPASQSAPSPAMMQRAMEMRAQGNAREPMFRTLLRVRREMMKDGTLE